MPVQNNSGCFSDKELQIINDRFPNLGLELGDILDRIFVKLLASGGISELSYDAATCVLTHDDGQGTVVTYNLSQAWGIEFDAATCTLKFTDKFGTETELEIEQVPNISLNADCELVVTDKAGAITVLADLSILEQTLSLNATTCAVELTGKDGLIKDSVLLPDQTLQLNAATCAVELTDKKGVLKDSVVLPDQRLSTDFTDPADCKIILSDKKGVALDTISLPAAVSDLRLNADCDLEILGKTGLVSKTIDLPAVIDSAEYNTDCEIEFQDKDGAVIATLEQKNFVELCDKDEDTKVIVDDGSDNDEICFQVGGVATNSIVEGTRNGDSTYQGFNLADKTPLAPVHIEYNGTTGKGGNTTNDVSNGAILIEAVNLSTPHSMGIDANEIITIGTSLNLAGQGNGAQTGDNAINFCVSKVGDTIGFTEQQVAGRFDCDGRFILNDPSIPQTDYNATHKLDIAIASTDAIRVRSMPNTLNQIAVTPATNFLYTDPVGCFKSGSLADILPDDVCDLAPFAASTVTTDHVLIFNNGVCSLVDQCDVPASKLSDKDGDTCVYVSNRTSGADNDEICFQVNGLPAVSIVEAALPTHVANTGFNGIKDPAAPVHVGSSETIGKGINGNQNASVLIEYTGTNPLLIGQSLGLDTNEIRTEGGALLFQSEQQPSQGNANFIWCTTKAGAAAGTQGVQQMQLDCDGHLTLHDGGNNYNASATHKLEIHDTTDAIKITQMPNTLDQTGATPALNFIYSDANGCFKSGALSSIVPEDVCDLEPIASANLGALPALPAGQLYELCIDAAKNCVIAEKCAPESYEAWHTGAQVIATGAYNTIPMTTQRYARTWATVAAGQITLAAGFEYTIQAHFTGEMVGNDSRTTLRHRILVNGASPVQNGFRSYHRENPSGDQTSTKEITLEATTASVIALQTTRLNGTGTVEAVDGETSFTITRLRKL